MDKELGPIEEYLRELRASLRTPADLTSRILVEAEDHLKDSGTTAGIVISGATFVVLSLLNALGLSFPGAVPAGIVSLGMIVGCAVRMFRRLPSTE